LKLIFNLFNEKREIPGFSKDELITIKKKVSDYKSGKLDQSEVMNLFQNKFPENLLEEHSNYIEHLEKFIDKYLIKTIESKAEFEYDLYYLRTGLMEEIKLITNNLLNLKLNCQNSKRFLKENSYLNSYISRINKTFEKSKQIQARLKPIQNTPINYENLSKIWLQTNKIKNLQYLMTHPNEDLEVWEEISSLYEYLREKGGKEKKGGIFSKKGAEVIFQFKLITDFISNTHKENFNFYCDLYFLLHKNRNLAQVEEQEFSNILERKEIKNELRTYLRSIIKDLIKTQLKDFIQEINVFKTNSEYEKEDVLLDLESLEEKKIKIFLPQLVDLYFIGLENHYQSQATDLQNFEQFNGIIQEYSEKIEKLYEKIEAIKKYSSNYQSFLNPYEEILVSLHKIFSNLLEDVYRRKEEFIYHLEAIKKEKMKQDIRTFVSEKIDELNSLIREYRDEMAVLLKEKLPQLNNLEEIIDTYKHQISIIKDDVYQKLREHEEKDLDQYQIIKKWEENYKRRKEQIGFLLSQYLTNLYKDFEGLIEKEEALFDRIKDITKYGTEQDELPLNYAFSSFLADKLTEDELRERIVELKAKLNKLNHMETLYRDELSQLEETLKTKVKIREGISTSNVQCGICRKEINFAKDKIIKCSFCDAVYHYLCVAFWLSKYNSCPSCQNAFLDPNQNIYETQPEE